MLAREAYEYTRQHREDVGLQEGNEQLEDVHEDAEEDGNNREPPVEHRAHLSCQEDDGNDAQQHDMSRHDVRKETHHQAEGLREHPDNLDEGHQGEGLQEDGNVGPENLLPVVLVAEDVDGKERADGKEERDGDVSRQVGPAGEEGDDAHQVVDEDEEEGRQQVGRVTVGILPYGILDDVVVNHHHQHLHQSHDARRYFPQHIVVAVPARASQHEPHEQQAGDDEREDILGDADVKRLQERAVGQHLHDFALVLLSALRDAEALVGLPFGNVVRREDVPTRLLAPHDDGQMDGNGLAFDGGDVPLVRVTDVPEDVFVHIYLARLLACGRDLLLRGNGFRSRSVVGPCCRAQAQQGNKDGYDF